MPDLFPTAIDKTFLVRTGDAHTFTLQRLTCYIFELEDIRFHVDSAVVLPDPPDDPSVPVSDREVKPRVTSLVAIAASLRHAAANPAHRLLIAAHADTSGGTQHNVELTQARGGNALAVVVGDRDRFVDSAHARHKTEDVQHILRWLARDWAWDCDPRRIDDRQGPDTDAAIRRFKQTYNAELGKRIVENQVVDRELWSAVYDCYQREIEELLDVDSTGLASLRSKLQFVDDGRRSVGCGEAFPIDAPQRQAYRSQSNRRLELVFFEQRDAPPLRCHPAPGRCVPADCRVHDPRMYEPRVLAIEPVAPRRSYTTINVALRDRTAALIERAPYRMQAGTSSCAGRSPDGIVSITVRGTPSRCRVEWGGTDDPEIDERSPPRFELELHVDYDLGSEDEQARKRLHNIGYLDKYAFDVALRAFQRDAGLPQTGALDEVTRARLADDHGTLATRARVEEDADNG